MLKHPLAFALSASLAMAALPTLAQTLVATSPAGNQAVEQVEVGEKLAVYWDSPLYPAESKARHEQGTAEVRVDYVKGQLVGEPSILVTSRSPRLDQAALKVARQLSFVPEGSNPELFTKRLRFQIEFVRDSHLTLKTKTCQELVEDIGYARTVTPGLPLQQMRVYELTMGIYTIAYMQVNTQAALKASQLMPEAYANMVARCQANPKALVTEVLKAEFKKLM